MFNKFICLGLIFAMLSFVAVKPGYAQSKDDKESAKKIVKIKKGIEKLGTGEDAKIRIKLLDKTKIKGYVKETSKDDFIVVERKNGQERVIKYADIKSVKGKNLSLGVKIGIVVGAVVVGLLVALAIIQRGEA